MEITNVISIPNLNQLKSTVGSDNSVALLMGKITGGDGEGGIYMWSSTMDVDTPIQFMVSGI